MDKLLEDFGQHFVIQGKSSYTIKKYLRDLRQFFRNKNISQVNQITRKSINDWILLLRNKERCDGHIANHLWAVKAFLRFLREEKNMRCYEYDIKIPRVKAPEVVEYLEPEELKKIFDVIDLENISGLRLRVLIEVMINTGLRPGETLALDRREIENDQIDVVGKGGKQRKVYINERVKEWARLYIAERTDDHPALFVSHQTRFDVNRLSHRHAQYVFQEHFRKAGINKRVVLHTMRHTYATTLLANGCPLDYVAVLLGHSKVETTRRHYVSIQHKHAKKAHFRYLSYEVEEDTLQNE